MASPRLVTRSVAGTPVNFQGQVNMVTRRIAGAFAPTLRSSLIAAFCMSAALSAQSSNPPQPTPPAPAVEPAAPPQQDPQPATAQPAVEQGAPQDATPIYGRVRAEEARLRCWPGDVASPPLYEDVLTSGQVVQLGERENGYRAVILPLGPVGYVSKRFTAEAADGTVTTSGTKVAFRYRPRTSEAPVDQLPKGTQVHVIGEQEGWYQVRAVAVKAWISNADVEVVEATDDVIQAYEDYAAEVRKQPQARLDAIAAAAKQRELDRIDMEAVQVVEVAFRREMKKPATEQRFDGLVTALAKVEKGLQKKGSARTAAAALRKRIETQQWVNEAMQVAEEKPPEVDQPPRPATPKDRLERFEAIGWLRYQSRLTEPG
ncbi:MAG: SH3 domain-containing protein, partial [Planctomycetota bacterium]|nr:SH3 domain-containing protein [Planctomycetota bacterium]